MSTLLRIINSLPVLYLVMLWPGRFVVQGLIWEDFYFAWMMYDSGIWAIYWLIVTMSVTPVLLLLRRIGSFPSLGRWLLRRRRHFGIGSFIYAMLHLTHYVLERWDFAYILQEAVELEFATGWVAIVIFAALALTSNRQSVQKLGTKWKSLHRWIYLAAPLSFLHWYLFDFFTGRVLFWAGLLVMAKLIHIALVQWRSYASKAPT